MYDRFNREITYLRISVTDRCNLRCTYCMPSCGVDLKSHHDMLTFEEITEIARVAVGLGIRKIRLTGGEPLVRRGIVELVRQLAAIEGLETLAMTTNGILLPRYARDLRAAGLQAVNISLDTLDAARYREMTRGGRVEDAVAGVDAAIVAGFRPIKINVVVPEAAASDPGAE
ncbi:MAG: GTP 3',8-cyclase MoaA, partial [bacterium]